MNNKRLRMFAGPNGSGKSTLKLLIEERLPEYDLFGNYINPDEIEALVRATRALDLKSYGLSSRKDEILEFFTHSSFLQKEQLSQQANELDYIDGKLLFHRVEINSYFASVAADFIRQKLLNAKQSFTFETVMSSPDKVDFFCKAKNLGYRTYLYYIATDDPLINISRVEQRSASGGHSVPKEKTIARYERSLSLLMPAIRCSDRAYIFDNSQHTTISWIAEISNGKILEPRTDELPMWFKKVLEANK
jgi:predicted ABC-type ATPase